jgi:hypothetical protein
LVFVDFDAGDGLPIFSSDVQGNWTVADVKIDMVAYAVSAEGFHSWGDPSVDQQTRAPLLEYVGTYTATPTNGPSQTLNMMATNSGINGFGSHRVKHPPVNIVGLNCKQQAGQILTTRDPLSNVLHRFLIPMSRVRRLAGTTVQRHGERILTGGLRGERTVEPPRIALVC